jgi:hypothetical protein
MTEKQSANKSMKDQTISWLKEHRLLVVLTIIFIPFFPFLIAIPFVFGVVAVFSEAMLTALVEAIATILGFFGLIFVYALTSLDNRTDMLNTAWFEMRKDMTPEYPQVWAKAVENVAKNKKKLVSNSLITGIFLVLSLLFAILALGFPNEDVVLYLTTFSVGLLFSSILQIFWTIYDLGKDPAQSSK